MARLLPYGRILSKVSFLALWILAVACFQTPVAFAQHFGGHTGGAGARVFVPPITHSPVSRPPLPVRPPVTPYRSAGLLYRPYPFRPFPRFYPVYNYFFFGPQNWWYWTNLSYNSCWWTSCYLFWNWGYPYSASPFYQYPPVSTYQYPLYFYGDQRRDYPELYLKDGTVLTVTDYWLADEQLHFTMIEGGESVEHTIAVDDLDLQKTVEVNTRRGFRFVLRNEPMEQYLQHHPDQPPPIWAPPKN
jgi:hypothetical protein